MKYKIILGIILPLLVIILITMLGSLGPGFDIDRSFEDSIVSKEVFKKNYDNNAIRIGEVKISNDYFLPKRYEAQIYVVCAYDEQGVRPLTSVGAVFYNEGEFSETARFADISKASSLYYGGYYNEYSNYKTSIELDAGESKTLQVYLSSNRYYYDYVSSNYGDYDKILIVEQNENNNLNCESLSSEQIQDSYKLNIIFPQNICTDSDTDINTDYYSIRNKIAYAGNCNDNSGVTHIDNCLDGDTVVEYLCSPKGDGEACSTAEYNCKDYGYSSCTSGYCV